MASKQKHSSGGTRKYGRAARKPKNAAYKNENHRFKNKLKRVRQSSGEKAARRYAAKKPCHSKRYGGRRDA